MAVQDNEHKMTREEFENAVQDILVFWPDEIDVSEKIFSSNGRVRKIQSFVDAHDAVEDRMRLDPKFYDEKTDKYPAYGGWAVVIDWEMYKVLYEVAAEQDCTVVYPKDICLEALLKMCLKIEDFAKEWQS